MIPVEERLQQAEHAISGIERLVHGYLEALAGKVVRDNAVHAPSLEKHQFASHGYAWAATYLEALRQLADWSGRLLEQGGFTELDQAVFKTGTGAYLQQLLHGIAMSQDEVFRPGDVLSPAILPELMADDSINQLIRDGNTIENRVRIAELLAGGEQPVDPTLDPTLTLVREQFRRFTDEEIAGQAGVWHRQDSLIPSGLIRQLAEMGVFAVCIPEQYGGHALGKLAMCVITEELSRGYLGVGSLATRSEIAAELILKAGTEEQKRRYLPGIASGDILPAVLVTEPDAGSDLAGLKTRAVKAGDCYGITGNKTWSTHAGRANLMVLLARTDPTEKGYRGLSMFLVDKPGGTDAEPFPLQGMSGSEIPVLGYRGMKEYEISFDGCRANPDGLLGGVEGQGFRQLMASFEAGRLQTAARAVGVAQNALELALDYARQRVQFGKPILAFPRVAGKIGWMAAEIMLLRQLVYFAARQADTGRRCDVEAGMAKMLSARVAWSCADNALQIHGGNGYATEFEISRVLCDARVLSIFEGSAEIQANIIARGLLKRRLQKSTG